MFNKKGVAILLIIAIITSNLGMSTLAMSINRFIVNWTERSNEIVKDVTHKYYEQFRRT